MRAAGPSGVLRVLAGCTAVGKTQAALRWAEAHGAEIVSCDSLLFYRGMDIGTAKPAPGELARVPHHLIDIRNVDEPMNVATYSVLAREAAASAASRGRPVLVVGGSGLYLRSFFEPVTDSVAVPAETRRVVAALAQAAGTAGLVEELIRLNPAGLGRLDTANPRRVAAALGRCLASGRTLAELAAEFAQAPRPYAGWDVRLVRLERTPEELGRRIALRTSQMLRAGLLEEVRQLLDRGLRSNPSALRAIGYREAVEVIEGRAAQEGLFEAIVQATRALVKKQRTWFRTQLPEHPSVDGAVLGDAAGLFGP